MYVCMYIRIHIYMYTHKYIYIQTRVPRDRTNFKHVEVSPNARLMTHDS